MSFGESGEVTHAEDGADSGSPRIAALVKDGRENGGEVAMAHLHVPGSSDMSGSKSKKELYMRGGLGGSFNDLHKMKEWMAASFLCLCLYPYESRSKHCLQLARGGRAAEQCLFHDN